MNKPAIGSEITHKGITYIVVQAQDADDFEARALHNIARIYREQNAVDVALQRPKSRGAIYSAKVFLKTGNMTEPISI